ncbi:MAG: hypothetical protein IKP25_02045 [Ruminococcus sp.]|nr:hypothetical protein [Ruminococcus sp.]
MKKIIACIAASAMLLSISASCGSKDKKGSEAVSSADTQSATAGKAAVSLDDVELEDNIAAASGDAYLSVIDKQNWIKYFGDQWNEKEDKNQLAFNAGIAHITGNGDYTVSVDADTKGFRFAATSDPDDQYTPMGLKIMSVCIKDGETQLPGAVITIKTVRVDGREVELGSKAYISTDDGAETKAFLFNSWKSEPPVDSRTAEGALYTGGEPNELFSQYSANVVSEADFSEWTKIEVDFTVSGL